MRYVLFLLLTAGLLVAGFVPQSLEAQAKLASNGFVFLELPATARQAALGEAYSALDVGDATAVFSNPAALAYVSNVSVGGSYGQWIADMNHMTGSAAMRLGNFGVIGLSLIYMDFGDFKNTLQTDDPAFDGYQDIGTFSASAYAVGVTYAYQMTDRFSFGGTVRYVKESTSTFAAVEEITSGEADNFLFELGTLYYTGFRSLRIATTAQNVGFNAEYFGNAFQPPIVYRLGMAYDFFDVPGSPIKMTTIVEAVHATDLAEKIHAGAEFAIMDVLILRGGYKFDYDEEGFSVGIGLNVPVSQAQGFRVDYSFTDFGVFDNLSRITASASF